MSTHKYIDQLCAVVVVLCLLLTIAFMNGKSLGLQSAGTSIGYEDRLFNTERVHTIDIVMDDWEGFLETCENEEYVNCAVVVDGESYKNTAVRAKGNTSLSMVSSMNSNRYSFKLEFDHYDSARTYHGLDKLSLNNIIQDATYMKDYLTYQMMDSFGVDAPLCSYVYITVNGEDWGLYLAVEGVEDAFLQRNYGTDPGELYKPDSTGFGGGRGNGRNFNMEDLTENDVRFSPPDGMEFENRFADHGMDQETDGGPGRGRGNMNGGGPGGGMGSDDVKLKYIDDDPESYSNIFQNAKTDISQADQARLIAALKALSEGVDLENTLDIDEVIRYFVVHNFVCNGDSYTGSMIHNYYLYEKDGRLSMIPWDYNLAYGTFQGSNASDAVNDPIDTPVSGNDSRPMVDWIFDNPDYTAQYHQYLQEFLETVDITGLINHAAELIAPYVEKDPTRFYSYEEFETGVETLSAFCRLRSESVSGQLNGSIPSTAAGQAADPSGLIDASAITLSDIGTMNHGGGFPGMGADDGNRSSRMPGNPSAGAQMPDAFRRNDRGDEAFDGKNTFKGGGFHGEMDSNRSPSGEIPSQVTGYSLAMTVISLVILLAGLGFALLCKRKKQYSQ